MNTNLNKNINAARWLVLVLAICLGAASCANAMELRIISLECLETEDAETDETLLKITGDVEDYRYRQDMRRGYWTNLNIRLTIRRSVEVKLYDLDSGPFDHNDFLGSFYIYAFPMRRDHTHTFDRDGARYKLVYRVVED